MQLAHMTWQQVEAHLERGAAVMVPVGSTEQHGPMGIIGTDTICAEAVALRAAELCDAIVAPPLAYTPAPFNTAFPGTVSMPEDLFQAHATAVFRGLLSQGFRGVFVVNGHGANVEPLKRAAQELPPGQVVVQSWWEPQEVNELRRTLYGDWEGMHATPSEVAITQALLGELPANEAATPPRKLSAEYIKAHAGDRHGPPDAHRAEFPDGRVGSHSALANPEDGARLLQAAAAGICVDFLEFSRRE
ncbi:MAG: creatininase family protein [Rhodobacteraceae bacterium]|nr:creatininase family protein [Paracoccaceae bacterium]